MQITSTDSTGVNVTRTVVETFPGYTSGKIVEMIVTGLETGSVYTFSAKAQNMFGSSEFSENSENVFIEEQSRLHSLACYL